MKSFHVRQGDNIMQINADYYTVERGTLLFFTKGSTYPLAGFADGAWLYVIPKP